MRSINGDSDKGENFQCNKVSQLNPKQKDKPEKRGVNHK